MTTDETHAGPRRIDLNADLGEGFPNDARLLALVTSAGVSCGAHAGGPGTIRATLIEAAARGVAVGAHPGYPDREGFGRRERDLGADSVERLIVEQCGELARLAADCGASVRFLKPHGALYNQAQKDPETARGVVAAALRLGLPVLGQPGWEVDRLCASTGARFVSEGFPDRRYGPDRRLVARSEPGAVLHDPAEVEAQVVRLVAEGLDTLCLHGDHPDAVANAQMVRAVLDRHGILPRFWGLDRP